MTTPILEAKHVTKKFGGLTALNDISFKVAPGSIHGLIGPNGAGKSTLFKNIAGFYKPSKGHIYYNGKVISGKKPHVIAKLGIVRTFQETTLFEQLTVFDNVLVGNHLTAKTNLFAAILGLDGQKRKKAQEKTMAVLELMGLADRAEQLAAELPLGSQRALAIAVALAAEPQLILMDEPFAGMNINETQQMMALTHKVKESGVTVVLVEHDMKAVMGLCHQLTVLNFGQLLAEGSPEAIKNNDEVIAAYLGSGID